MYIHKISRCRNFKNEKFKIIKKNLEIEIYQKKVIEKHFEIKDNFEAKFDENQIYERKFKLISKNFRMKIKKIQKNV